jgi:hypothetical protein
MRLVAIALFLSIHCQAMAESQGPVTDTQLRTKSTSRTATVSGRQENYYAAYAICLNVVPVAHVDFSLANGIQGGSGALHYFWAEHKDYSVDPKSWKATLLDNPKHGRLVPLPAGGYMYHPIEGFLSVDEVTFSVEAEGKTFKEVYSLHVQDTPPEYGVCPDYGVTKTGGPK